MKSRWFTCTPVDFSGGGEFFSRDSGLMCRGLLANGCEARAVMPGLPRPGDYPELIRTEYSNLESPTWWKDHHLEGVVLYAWGSPRFRKVAEAIHEAGIFLVLNQDNGGLISPLAGVRGWLDEQRVLSGGGADFLKLAFRGFAGLLAVDPARAAHLKQGDVIACVSPVAAERYGKLCRIYGGAALAERVTMLPHPVESEFTLRTERKIHQVACIGRWEDERQKRPALMQTVVRKLAEADPEVRVDIAGAITPDLGHWHGSLAENLRGRITLRGLLQHDELVTMLELSRVFYSPSAFESFGIAAGEALCCGCSVVAGRSPSMASFEWFVSGDSGRLAEQDDAAGHLTALREELDCWKNGGRDAAAISARWGKQLHEREVAARVLELRTSRHRG